MADHVQLAYSVAERIGELCARDGLTEPAANPYRRYSRLWEQFRVGFFRVSPASIGHNGGPPLD